MDKKVYYVTEANRRHIFTEMWQNVPVGWRIEVRPPGRSLDQNAKLWPMLQDVARQVEWYGKKLTDDEWKDVFTAALKKHNVVPGIDGGFVVCGLHTSKMSKHEFCELIELIYAFGAQHNVIWSERAVQVYKGRIIDITPERLGLPEPAPKALPNNS